MPSKTHKSNHPDKPKPYSNIKDVVFKAFSKINSTIQRKDIINITKKHSGLVIEVVKTVKSLNQNQLSKLISLFKFNSYKLARFKMMPVNINGSPKIKFLFQLQQTRRIVTSSLHKCQVFHSVLNEDLKQAYSSLSKFGLNKPSIVIARLNTFFQLIKAMEENERKHNAIASVNIKELSNKYAPNTFVIRFSNRDNSLDVKRTVTAYNREHALQICKEQKLIPKGFKPFYISGRAQALVAK